MSLCEEDFEELMPSPPPFHKNQGVSLLGGLINIFFDYSSLGVLHVDIVSHPTLRLVSVPTTLSSLSLDEVSVKNLCASTSNIISPRSYNFSRPERVAPRHIPPSRKFFYENKKIHNIPKKIERKKMPYNDRPAPYRSIDKTRK